MISKEAGLPVLHVPGEHEWLDETPGKAYLACFGKGTLGSGWNSFDHGGVHFVALNNVASFKPGGLGHLGDDQLGWLKKDRNSALRSTATPLSRTARSTSTRWRLIKSMLNLIATCAKPAFSATPRPSSRT